MPVGRRRGGGAQRIDGDHLGPVGPRFFDEWPQVAVGQLGVGPPEQDESGVAEVCRVGGQGTAIRRGSPGAGGGAAEGSGLSRRPDARKEAAVEGAHLNQPLGTGVPPGKDGFTAPPVDDLVQAAGDVFEGSVPADLLEVSRTFRAGSHQRFQDSVGAVDTIEEVIDLGAEFAAGVRVVGVAA